MALVPTYPDAFRGAMQRFEPYPFITGSAYSSHAPANIYFSPFVLQDPLAVQYLNVFKSMNASVPGAQSQNSTGSAGYSYSHGVSLFRRVAWDTGNNTNFSFIGSASFGLSATLTYGSATQTFDMRWVTDTTGGTSGYATSGTQGSGWSSYATGPKMIEIPWNTVLPAGEYFIAHQHSSTTNTSQSNITLLSFSNLHIAPQLITFGSLGGSSTYAWLGVSGEGLGVASAVTTSDTMAASVVSASVVNLWVQQFSNGQ